MQIKDIMTRDVEMINSNTSLIEAARKMNQFDIGCLPVWEGESLVGLITDRDIVIRAIAEGENPSKCKVGKVMTTEVFYCFENDDIEEAAQLMEDKCIRRLVVLNAEGTPVGLVSVSDFSVKSHNEHLCGQLLEKVCSPAGPHR